MSPSKIKKRGNRPHIAAGTRRRPARRAACNPRGPLFLDHHHYRGCPGFPSIRRCRAQSRARPGACSGAPFRTAARPRRPPKQTGPGLRRPPRCLAARLPLVAATARAADWPEKYLGAKGDQYNDDCRICEQGEQKAPDEYSKTGKVTTLSNVDEDGEPVALLPKDTEVLVDNAAAFCASVCKYSLIDDEVLKVTSTDGNVLTVVRGVDGTQKAYHVAGSDIYLLNYSEQDDGEDVLEKTEGASWNSTKRLWEMKEYRNFPFRWSGAVGVWEKDEATLEREYPDQSQWRDRKDAKGCFEECRRRVPFPAPPTRRGAPQAVLRREEGGLPRTAHQRRRLRLPPSSCSACLLWCCCRCAGLPGVQPAGGAPRRQDGRKRLGA